jgi:acetolactate synthase I/II/III large subunit
MRVYEQVIDQLVEAGIDLFAGMVGSTSAPYVSSLAPRNNVRYIGVRHEQVAASIVDAAARLTGRPGCLITHGASGALAASLGVAAAAADSVPMFHLSTTQERIAMERGYWQAVDVLKPMAGFVKWQARVERPERASEVIRQGLIEAVSGRPGVSQVDIPIDVSIAEYQGKKPDVIVCSAPLYRPCASEENVRRTIDLLRRSSRPVILVGGGVAFSGAGEQISRLARRLLAPVVNSATSRGHVAEDDELFFGSSGIVGYEPIGDLIKESDLILALGSRLSDLQLARNELLPDGVAIVQVNIDPGSIARFQNVELGIVADVRCFTEQLNNALDAASLPEPAESRRDWLVRKAKRVRDWKKAWLASAPANHYLQPQQVVQAMAEMIPRDAILCHGAGTHSYYGYLLPVVPPGAHLLSAHLGAMGCALGYGIGAKLARPDQTVVVCIGDGDFMLQIGDMETLVREKLKVIIIVFNNFRLGSQYERVRAYGNVLGVEHGNPDFAKLATIFGCTGIRVEKAGELGGALRQAMTCDGAAVIDLIVDPESQAPQNKLSETAH